MLTEDPALRSVAMAGGTSVLALLLLCSACTLGFPQVGEVSMLEEHVEQAAPHVEAADRRAMRNSEVKTSTDKDAEKAASADAEGHVSFLDFECVICGFPRNTYNGARPDIS